MEIVQPEIKNSPRVRIYTFLPRHSRRGIYTVDERFIIRSDELYVYTKIEGIER